jgi:hypothetical protein
MWLAIGLTRSKLDRQRYLNANRLSAIRDPIIAIASQHVDSSKKSASGRQFLEARLRTHYPNLHNGDSLFPEFDFGNFSAIGHRGYARLVRELRVLQNRLYDGTKFEKLIRYHCANLFFIVLSDQLFCDPGCLYAGAL